VAESNEQLAARSTAGSASHLRSLLAGGRSAWAMCRGPAAVHRLSGERKVLAHMPAWLLLIGLLEGVAWLACYGLTWKLFGQIMGDRPMAAACVWLLDVLAIGSPAILALGTLPDWLRSGHGMPQPDKLRRVLSPGSVIGLVVLVGLQYVLLNSLPAGYHWYPNDWRRVFHFAFPQPIFRVLLLAPLWRRWGMVLAAGLGRMHPSAHPSLADLGRTMTPWRVLLSWLLPAGMTGLWCSSDQNTLLGVVLAVAVLGAVYPIGVWLSRATGGQSGRSMLALGQTTLVLFLSGYLICAQILEDTW
jgi:hypothetical protein